LKKGDLGGFKNLQVAGIYGKRYKQPTLVHQIWAPVYLPACDLKGDYIL
jgi:hypothetical protein